MMVPPGLVLTYAVVAFIVSIGTILVAKRLAAGRGWLDRAGDDPLKIHAAPTPFVGGIGILLGYSTAVALYSAQAAAVDLAGVLVIAWAVAALGFRDDVASVPPSMRLALESLAGVLVATTGVASGLLVWPLPGPAGLGLLAVMVVFYVVGGINAVNMQDGLDGLAGGIAVISCLGMALVAHRTGDARMIVLGVSLASALAAFLVFNVHPASVFMGDNGTYFLGFTLAVMALRLTLADGTWRGLVGGVLLFGVPVMDAAFAIGRRLARGVSPFAGDRSHFYDVLVQRGLTVRRAVLVSYALQVISVGLGLVLLGPGSAAR
jgi:UDP-GlcNAc:undecaprenyl-phosphate GlcNAc-1-phosphate transferase